MVGEAQTVKTMLATLNETGVLIDPHTAVGVAAMQRVGDLGAPVVVMSTAHPAKFPETVKAATGVEPQLPRGTASLAERAERFDSLKPDLAAVGAYVRDFAAA